MSSPDIVEALGLCWFGETVSREGLRKQTTAQQNKTQEKENSYYFVTSGWQNSGKSIGAGEMNKNSQRRLRGL